MLILNARDASSAYSHVPNLVLQVLQWVSAVCWLLHILASVQQLYSEGNAGPHIPTSQRQLNQLIQRLSAQLRSTSPRLDEPDSEHARMLGVAGGGAGGVRTHLARHQREREQNRKHAANDLNGHGIGIGSGSDSGNGSGNGNGGASLFDRLRHPKQQPHARLLSQPDSTSDGRSAGLAADAELSAMPAVLIHPPTGAAAANGSGDNEGDGDGEGVFRFSHVSDTRSLLDDLKNVNAERKQPQPHLQTHTQAQAESALRPNGHSSDQLSDDVFAPDEARRANANANAPTSSETSRAAAAANTLGERCFTGVSGIELDDIDGRLPTPR